MAAVPPAAPTDHAEALAWADRLRDVPHVWGGVSAYGVDCSGLVHLVWRRFGVILPRDARDQASVIEPVPAGQERPGDLYFFGQAGVGVNHVGFVAEPVDGTRQILHACEIQGRVVLEPIPPDRLATLVGIGRVRT